MKIPNLFCAARMLESTRPTSFNWSPHASSEMLSFILSGCGETLDPNRNSVKFLSEYNVWEKWESVAVQLVMWMSSFWWHTSEPAELIGQTWTKKNFQWSWSPHKTSSTICLVSTGNTYLHCWFTEDVTNDEGWKCVYVIYDSPDNRINPNVLFETLKVRRPAERPNSGFETEKQRLIGSTFRNTAINTAMPIQKAHWLLFCWMLHNR